MHVAVTGASSGIGESLAREYARRGASLTLVARRRELLEKLASACGTPAHVVVQDLSETERAADWISGAVAALGPIDVLCNNAGVENTGAMLRSDPAEGERLLRLNLLSPLRIVHATLPAMTARGRGTIVNVTSVAALAATPGLVWYCASKAGLAGASETLRSEIRSSGVNVLTVYPRPVKTAMADATLEAYGGRSGPAGRAPEGDPDQLAVLICDAVEKRAARVIYPRDYAPSYWAPWLARWVMNRLAPPLVERRR